jgi:hypothetical protein
MSIFDKYANTIDAKALEASQKEINENNSGDYPEIPLGKYEVKIEKMEAKLSSSKNPMISIWFKILEGDFKDSFIFYNGVFYEDWMRHRVVKMLSDILADSSHEAEINLILKDSKLDEINNFVMDIHEEVDGKFEYLLDYGERKGFNTYKIVEVYE